MNPLTPTPLRPPPFPYGRGICGEFSVIWRAKRPQVSGTLKTFAHHEERGRGPVWFPPRWTGWNRTVHVFFKGDQLWNSFFLFVFQILIYIFKPILLSINPLLLAFRILYFSEICSTPKRVEHQNSANSPKTLQNGLRRGQTTKNTTRQ